MSVYGYLSKDTWTIIINFLEEKYWIDLKCLNKQFLEMFKRNLFIKRLKFKELCLAGHIESVLFLVRNVRCFSRDSGLKYGCYSGSSEIVNLMIKMGASNWNKGLKWACKGNQKKMVDLMFEKGANNLVMGLKGACRGNQKEMVNLMMEKGVWDWRNGLASACLSGSIELVKFMYDKAASLTDRRYDIGLGVVLEYAYRGGNEEIIQYLIEKGAEYNIYTLEGACQSGNIGYVKMILEKLRGYLLTFHYQNAFNLSCKHGHIEIAKLMMKYSAPNWKKALYYACMKGKFETIKFLIENGADPKDGLEGACNGRHLEIVDYLISKGARWNHNWKNVLCPIECRGIIELMRMKGVY